jgi:hypothetical protein
VPCDLIKYPDTGERVGDTMKSWNQCEIFGNSHLTEIMERVARKSYDVQISPLRENGLAVKNTSSENIPKRCSTF